MSRSIPGMQNGCPRWLSKFLFQSPFAALFYTLWAPVAISEEEREIHRNFRGPHWRCQLLLHPLKVALLELDPNRWLTHRPHQSVPADRPLLPTAEQVQYFCLSQAFCSSTPSVA